MAKTKCEYGGGCIYCLYVDTCNHPAKENTDGIYRNDDIKLLLDKEKLDNALEQRYLTMAEVERRLGLCRSYISSKLNGGGKFPLSVAESIASIVGRSVKDIAIENQELEVSIIDWGLVDKSMQDKNISGTDISQKAGRNDSYFTGVRGGRALPRPELLDIVCEMLELPKDEVYEMQVLE